MFRKTIFNGRATFGKARIGINLIAQDAIFSGAASFIQISVGNSININNSVFIGPADFKELEISRHFIATKAEFRARADFGGSSVGGTVSFDQAILQSVSFLNATLSEDFTARETKFIESADFVRMKVNETIDVTSAVFEAPVDFKGAMIGYQFIATKAEFRARADFGGSSVGGTVSFDQAILQSVFFVNTTIDSDFILDGANCRAAAIFNGMNIGGNVSFDSATFHGPMRFESSIIRHSVSAVGAQFGGSDNESHFNWLDVGGDFLVTRAAFAGKTYFELNKISGDFVGDSARFSSMLNLTLTSIGGSAFFDKTIFSGAVLFWFTSINGNLIIHNAQLAGAEQVADFSRMAINGTVSILNATFLGPTRLIDVTAEGDFKIVDSHFANAEQGVSLIDMEIGRSLSLSNTTFDGPARFGYTKVGDSLSATNSRFLESASFDAIEVVGGVNFENTAFARSLTMVDASVSDLGLSGTEIYRLTLDVIDLSGTHIRRNLRLFSIDAKKLYMAFIHVDNYTSLENLTITEEANLVHSQLQVLKIASVQWPPSSNTLKLDGMSLTSIREINLDQLLALAERASYSADVYAQIQELALRQGLNEWADNAFVAQQRRERKNLIGTAWFASIALDYLVLYGRAPSRAFWWSIVFVALGVIVFLRRQGMLPRQPEYESRHYNPFWYSLDLFIPIIDLGMASVWIPRQDRRFARHYRIVHQVMGWLIVPIGLASITGIIK